MRWAHGSRSGHSIFSRPKPIDLSAARRAGFSLDIDLADEDTYGDASAAAALVPADVLFDAEGAGGGRREGLGGHGRKRSMTDMPRAAEAAQTRDDEDMWAELG